MAEREGEPECAWTPGPEQPARPPEARSLRPATWTDAELLEGLRGRDERALRELYERLAPQLRREARRLQVQPALREEAVCDVLRAVYDALVRPGAASPKSLTAYAVRALQRRALLLERIARAAHAPLETAHRVAAGESGDEHAPEDAASGDDRPLQRLAMALASSLTADERQLLSWLAEHVPQREIARWRGVEFGAMRGRILRLREKARRIAWRWVESRPPGERATLEGHLARVARPSRTSRPALQRRGAKAAQPGEIDDAAS